MTEQDQAALAACHESASKAVADMLTVRERERTERGIWNLTVQISLSLCVCDLLRVRNPNIWKIWIRHE